MVRGTSSTSLKMGRWERYTIGDLWEVETPYSSSKFYNSLGSLVYSPDEPLLFPPLPQKHL